MASTASRLSKRLLPLLVLLPVQTGWADWDLTPTLSVQERYSDNIDLAIASKQSSFLTEIRPGLRIQGKGGRGTYNVDYGLQSLYYSHDSGENNLNHQLNGTLKTELLEDHLFLDATANISQRSADLTQPTGTGNYNTSANSLESRSLSLTPAWRSRFGSTANFDARWQLSYSDTDDGTVSGTQGSNLNLLLSSGTAYPRTPWSVNYQQQNSNGDTNANRFNSLSGTLGYQYSRKTLFNLTVGHDANDGDTSAFTENSGNFWNLGLRWNPTSRTNLGASVGKRYNGNSYSLDFSHRTRKSLWSLRYSEQVTDTFGLLSTTGAYDIYICDIYVVRVPAGSGSPDPTLCGTTPAISNVPMTSTQLSDGFNLTKTWTGTTSYKTGKSTFALNLNNSRTKLLAGTGSDTTTSLIGSWNLRLNPRLSSALSLTGTQTKSSGLESKDWSVAWSLSRQLARQTQGVVEARHLVRDDSSSTGGYSENSLSARVNMSF